MGDDGKPTPRTKKVFEIVVTFVDGAVMGSANGVLLERTELPEEAVKLYGKLPASLPPGMFSEDSADPRVARGDVLGWLVFGPPDQPSPIGEALKRGLERVSAGSVSHVRLLLDFLPGSAVGVVDDTCDPRPAELLPWELMRWHGVPETPIWVAVHARIALVRQRRGSSYVQAAARLRPRLDVDYFTAMKDGSGPSSVDQAVLKALDYIQQRFPALDHRIITSEAASTSGHNLDLGRFTDMVGLYGDGSVDVGGNITWTQFPLAVGAPPATTTAQPLPSREILDRLTPISGHPTILFLLACSGDGDEAGLTTTGETLGDTFVRDGVPAVVSLFGSVDVEAAPALMYFLICALIEGGGLDVAVQTFRRSLRELEWTLDHAPPGVDRGVEWQKPMLTVSSTRALANTFALAELTVQPTSKIVDIAARARRPDAGDARFWDWLRKRDVVEKDWWPRRALEEELRSWGITGPEETNEGDR